MRTRGVLQRRLHREGGTARRRRERSPTGLYYVSGAPRWSRCHPAQRKRRTSSCNPLPEVETGRRFRFAESRSIRFARVIAKRTMLSTGEGTRVLRKFEPDPHPGLPPLGLSIPPPRCKVDSVYCVPSVYL